MSQSSERRWLSVEQAASYLGLRKSTIYAYIHDRKIPHYKKGHFVRFKADDLDAWMEEDRVEPLREKIKTDLQQKRGNKNGDTHEA